MTQNFDNVTISRREYDELNRKAFAFDTYKKRVKENKYSTDIEKLLFLGEEKVDIMDLMRDVAVNTNSEPVEEEPEPCISDEVWDEIEAMVEKEEGDAETV